MKCHVYVYHAGVQAAMDPYLDVVSRALRPRAAELLRVLDDRAHGICEEMRAAWAAVMAGRDALAGDRGALVVHERVDMLQRTMGSLRFNAARTPEFVDALMDAVGLLADGHGDCEDPAARQGAAASPRQAMQARLQRLLLETLANPNEQVREMAYARLDALLQGAGAGVEGEGEGQVALDRARRGTLLLLEAEVVYQMVAHGLASAATSRCAEAVVQRLVSIHGVPRVCQALVCVLPHGAAYVQEAGAGRGGGVEVSAETRELFWAAHKQASVEDQALGLVTVMMGWDALARRLASQELFRLLAIEGCVLAAELDAPLQDPLAFLAQDQQAADGCDVLLPAGPAAVRGGGAAGAVFEPSELENLVSVVGNASLKHSLRAAALDQLRRLALAPQSQAALLRAGVLDVLMQVLDTRTVAASMYLYAYTNVCMYVCVFICTSICTCTCLCIYTCTCVCRCVYEYIKI